MTGNAWLRVEAEPVPDHHPASREWDVWCRERSLDPLNSGRRAWIDSLRTYLRDANYLLYADGILIDIARRGDPDLILDGDSDSTDDFIGLIHRHRDGQP